MKGTETGFSTHPRGGGEFNTLVIVLPLGKRFRREGMKLAQKGEILS
jgi:hypothetical protein